MKTDRSLTRSQAVARMADHTDHAS